jgi:hypothetical protein
MQIRLDPMRQLHARLSGSQHLAQNQLSPAGQPDLSQISLHLNPIAPSISGLD